MSMDDLLEMTLREALEMSAREESPLCLHFKSEEVGRCVILVALGDEAEHLYTIAMERQKPDPSPLERN